MDKKIAQKIAHLNSQGQAVWLDNIDRKSLEFGTFDKYIATGISGVTTNPSIFERAFATDTSYQNQFEKLHAKNLKVKQIYQKLVLTDVKKAAEKLRHIYNKTNGKDGYVSIEVSPDLVHDVNGTINEATQVWETIAAPNVMIKVPATEAGIEAMQQLIYVGINVNITLLFSPQVYVKVVEQYKSALAKRVKEGKAIDKIYSVASFFVSRIDTVIDKLLGENSHWYGKFAVMNAQVAYQIFTNLILNSDEFAALQKNGANIQKLLWASTSTKNPKFPKLKYVNELVSEHTVNTIPLTTYNELKELKLPIDEPRKVTKSTFNSIVVSNRLNIQQIYEQLLSDGINSFQRAYSNSLLNLHI